MARRHMHATGKRLHVQRLGIVAVDAVAHAAQAGQVAQGGIVGGHGEMLPRLPGVLNACGALEGV